MILLLKWRPFLSLYIYNYLIFFCFWCLSHLKLLLWMCSVLVCTMWLHFRTKKTWQDKRLSHKKKYYLIYLLNFILFYFILFFCISNFCYGCVLSGNLLGLKKKKKNWGVVMSIMHSWRFTHIKVFLLFIFI